MDLIKITCTIFSSKLMMNNVTINKIICNVKFYSLNSVYIMMDKKQKLKILIGEKKEFELRLHFSSMTV